MNVESAGAYVPRYRATAETVGDAWDGFQARGIVEKRVPAGDEDVVTMAVEAARDALAASTHGRGDVTTLAVATTTPPADEGTIGAQIAEILGLSRDVEVSVHTQSTRSGTRALLAAVRADGPALAVAADAPSSAPGDAIEHAAGAGAVAFVAAPGPVVVQRTASYTREFPGTRFRQRGSGSVEAYGATGYERTAFTETVTGVGDRIDREPSAVAVTAPDGGLPARGAGALPFDAEPYHLVETLGDLGAASALFGLLAAWSAGEDEVLVVGYGGGAGADGVLLDGLLDVDWTRPAVDVSYAEYLRKRGHLDDGGES